MPVFPPVLVVALVVPLPVVVLFFLPPPLFDLLTVLIAVAVAVGLSCLECRLSVSTPNLVARPVALVHDLLAYRLVASTET